MFPEQVEHHRYNFPSYRIGGIPKAYMLFRGHMPECEAQVREYAEEMMTAARDSKGIMSHPHKPEEELIWIYVAMAVTPYLLFAGLALGEQRYIDEAAKQAFCTMKSFLTRKTASYISVRTLLAQAFILKITGVGEMDGDT